MSMMTWSERREENETESLHVCLQDPTPILYRATPILYRVPGRKSGMIYVDDDVERDERGE
jgi:hypothetical protein